MSNLEKLKQKLMIKPTLHEREPVNIIIKEQVNPAIKPIPKKMLKSDKMQNDEDEEVEQEQEQEVEQEKNRKKKELTNTIKPIIVDETDKGFDRNTLLTKIKESKLTKVFVKPILEVSELQKISEPILQTDIVEKISKPKRLNKKKLLSIEEDDVKMDEAKMDEPKIDDVKIDEAKIDEVIEENLMKPPAKKRERITQKNEKGVAILGPETNIVIGDTELTVRLPKRSPPINIKVSTYYMNNRERFVNFINSLFEPYRLEIQQNNESISCDDIGKTSTSFSLLTHQKIVRDYMNLYTPYRGLLLYHGLGSGKCLKINTPIIMADGTIKLVQDVNVGDLLMGDDSTPRTVMSLARGVDKMYDVIPIKGDKYTVNQEHILCLKAVNFPKMTHYKHKSNTNFNVQWVENNKFQTKIFNYNPADNENFMEMKLQSEIFYKEILTNKFTNKNIIEISIKDYLKLSNHTKSILKGYKVPIDFAEQCLDIDPYIIGYWLGNTSTDAAKLISKNSNVLHCFEEHDLNLTHLSRNEYEITGNNKNIFLSTLQKLNMINNKHVPSIYKCNSRENRLKLLAGFVDSNGHFTKNGFDFTFLHKNNRLIDDIIFLARSLGFASYKSINKTSWIQCKGIRKNGTAIKLIISGQGIEQIPTLILSKRANANKMVKEDAVKEDVVKEDVLITDIKVKYVNEDNYYGFVIDGNRRFLLGDFTVTHNTATSIAIAEGMKDSKKVIIMTPASLQANYVEELKKAGDLLYKKNQFWEWISTDTNPELAEIISAVLKLPLEYIRKQHGAWFINSKKKSNFDDLSDNDKKLLDDQLNKMIKEKYTFINYNGLRSKRLEELTNGYTKNLFDNSVIIVDEAHNLISRIVNKLKKEKPIQEDTRGEKDHLPINLSTKLYEYLLSAKNARIVLLTGTPVINYPNEFAILFNILRGYIKTWSFPLNIKTNKKIDKASLNEMLIGEKTHDYLDYSPSSKVLTITRNPFGFKNKVKKMTSEYQGVSNVTKNDKGESTFETDYIDDDEFERKIISILKRNDIDVVSTGIKIQNKKALPDDLDQFYNRYIDDSGKLKNTDALKRRIIGLSSYFRSAQENLLPKYNKTLGLDYHIVRVPMSNFQFKTYESARREERKSEKPKKPKAGDELKEPSSTYRIFSRLFCNYVMPNRPMPKDIAFSTMSDEITKFDLKNKIMSELIKKMQLNISKILLKALNEEEKKKIQEKINKEMEQAAETIFNSIVQETTNVNKSTEKKALPKKQKKEETNILGIGTDVTEPIEKELGAQFQQFKLEQPTLETTKNTNVENLMNEARRIENKQDLTDAEEGEIEGDEILDEIGGDTYKARVEDAIRFLADNSNDFLTPEALITYSPKFLHMLENIQDPEHKGLNLVYSQFRTLEGIGIFSLVLDKNGFTRFKIKKNSSGLWEINISEMDKGKPTYALYTGTETSEEKEIIRHIYNGEWDQIPDSISNELVKIANNNNMGEIIKVLMITSSGSEGINLRNTRYVHIMEPYWHPVRSEQVIGRARRICSHKSLPKELQTVEVFVYLMIFTEEQLKSDDAIELKRKDLGRGKPSVPLTSDQNLYEISEIKANLTGQLTDAVKETSFDCFIYSNGKCINFGEPTPDKFSYVPDYGEQQNDTTVQANKIAIEWVGKPINIAGVNYVYRRINPKLLNIYDKNSYESALKDSTIVPIQIGTLEINERGEQVFRQLVT